MVLTTNVEDYFRARVDHQHFHVFMHWCKRSIKMLHYFSKWDLTCKKSMAEEGKRSECSVDRLMRNEKYYIQNISDCSHWLSFLWEYRPFYS